MDNKFFLSICIPTYNRTIFVQQTLQSIIIQFKANKELLKLVEIIVLDNNSTDTTIKDLKKISYPFTNIRIKKNNQNLGMSKNLIHVADFAQGKYIWFFADDDLQTLDALVTVINRLQRYKPDVFFCNLSYFIEDKKIVFVNGMRQKNDKFFSGKKPFFSFLITKFDHAIDWYTTFYSNFILKREIFIKNRPIPDQFATKLDIHPHISLIYYTDTDMSFFVLAQPIVLYRLDNQKSFGPKNQLAFARYMDTVWKHHFNYIIKYNKEYVSIFFKIRTSLKNFRRKIYIARLLLFIFLFPSK